MKNEFELLLKVLLDFPQNPTTKQRFSMKVVPEAERLYQFFKNLADFGSTPDEQYRNMYFHSITMIEVHKHLDKVPHEFQVILVKKLNKTVGLISKHLNYLVPLIQPNGPSPEEQKQVEDMNAVLREKEAAIDARQGGKLDKLKATVEFYDEWHEKKEKELDSFFDKIDEVIVENYQMKMEKAKQQSRKAKLKNAFVFGFIILLVHVLINVWHSYAVRGTLTCKGKSMAFLLFAPTTAPGWDWSVCEVKPDTSKVAATRPGTK